MGIKMYDLFELLADSFFLAVVLALGWLGTLLLRPILLSALHGKGAKKNV